MSIQNLLGNKNVTVSFKEADYFSTSDYLSNMVFSSLLENAKVVSPTKRMYGTKAFHPLGDISRLELDEFVVTAETRDFWVGHWVDTVGFYNVLFPKVTSKANKPVNCLMEVDIVIIEIGLD